MVLEDSGRIRNSSSADDDSSTTIPRLTQVDIKDARDGVAVSDSGSSSDYTPEKPIDGMSPDQEATRDLEAARHTAKDKEGLASDSIAPLTPTGLTSQDGLEMLAREPSHHSIFSHDDHDHDHDHDDDSDSDSHQRRPAAISRIQSRASTAHASNLSPTAPAPALAQVTSIIEIPDTFYDTHTRRRKIVLVCFCSFCAFLSPISSTSNLSATPEIANEFGTTGSVINVSNALYLLFMGISPMFVGPLSQVFGRRMVSLLLSFLHIGLYSERARSSPLKGTRNTNTGIHRSTLWQHGASLPPRLARLCPPI